MWFVTLYLHEWDHIRDLEGIYAVGIQPERLATKRIAVKGNWAQIDSKI